MSANTKTQDKASIQYWDTVWAGQAIPTPINPRVAGLRNHVNRQFDALFHQVFAGDTTRGKTLLEIGCARSRWLPYFAQEFGFHVSGLDYSDIGCEMERQVLAKAEVEGEVVCADLFSPPANMEEAFDVVVSFGVVEHFQDTTACIRAMSRYLKPGGLLFTEIPNLTGSIGAVQKCLNRPVYDIHVPLGTNQLRKAHQEAGLTVEGCDYFLATNYCVLNVNGLDAGRLSTRVKSLCMKTLMACSAMVWAIESLKVSLPTSRFASPYVYCAARKPE